MYKWSISSTKVWLSFCFYYLQTAYFYELWNLLENFWIPAFKESISHENLNIVGISYQQQLFQLKVFHNIRFSSHFFVTFESIALLLAIYSPFYFMPFLVLFRVPLAVFCPFWRPYSISCAIFSTRFTPFTCRFLWSLCLSIQELEL